MNNISCFTMRLIYDISCLPYIMFRLTLFTNFTKQIMKMVVVSLLPCPLYVIFSYLVTQLLRQIFPLQTALKEGGKELAPLTWIVLKWTQKNVISYFIYDP